MGKEVGNWQQCIPITLCVPGCLHETVLHVRVWVSIVSFQTHTGFVFKTLGKSLWPTPPLKRQLQGKTQETAATYLLEMILDVT